MPTLLKQMLSPPSLVREPYGTELDFFLKHPNVAGMAAEDDRVVLNPYSRLSAIERQAVVKNETARIYMRKNMRPEFALSEEQRRQFQAYGSEQDQRETVAARLFSGDPSAGQATPEQQEFVKQLKKKMQISE